MTNIEPIFVSFEPYTDHFIGAMSINDVLSSNQDLQSSLANAAHAYEQRVVHMRAIVRNIEEMRKRRQLTPARLIWQLGDEIFGLRDDLSTMSLQINGVYEHLTRDLGVKRKWLEKVVILRRYLLDQTLIPESLNWGQCEKGTRRIAQRLSQGLALR